MFASERPNIRSRTQVSAVETPAGSGAGRLQPLEDKMAEKTAADTSLEGVGARLVMGRDRTFERRWAASCSMACLSFLRRYSLGLGPRRKSYDSFFPFLFSLRTHQRLVLVIITVIDVEHCIFLPTVRTFCAEYSPMEHSVPWVSGETPSQARTRGHWQCINASVPIIPNPIRMFFIRVLCRNARIPVIPDRDRLSPRTSHSRLVEFVDGRRRRL